MVIRRLTFQAVRNVLKQRGFVIYEKPYELNIVGIRSNNTTPNKFDDAIFLFFKDNNNRWIFQGYPATTDPGTYWLRQPMQEQGTAILMQGQYVGAYQIGLHRGKYTALVQRGTLTIRRDYNRDALLDFNNGTLLSGTSFGINIHHANATGTTKIVDKYSAGCQVFANVEDFNSFLRLCEQHRELYGNKFTYSLIDLRAVKRKALFTKAIYGGVALGLLGLLAFSLPED
jgi:hypothetical protein